MKHFLKEFYNGCIQTKKTTNQSRGLFIGGCDLASRQRWSFCYARLWNSYTGCPQKNTLFELPFCETRFEGIRPSTASWLEGHIPSNLFSQFQKFRKCLFFGTPTWCSIAIVQSAIPWLAETMFALLVP